jgi:hypothetical protein
MQATAHLQVCGHRSAGGCFRSKVIFQGIQLPHQLLFIQVLGHTKGAAHYVLDLLVVVLRGGVGREEAL